MTNLVEVENKEIWAKSNIIARKMGIKHGYFMDVVRKVVKKVEKLRVGVGDPRYKYEMSHYRGQDFSICLMNREFFSLVMMRFETPKAFEWQVKFNAAFYAMEEAIIKAQTNKDDIEWTQTRQIGKQARLEETDAIQEYVEYCVAAGSKRAKFYYSLITDATYKALGFMAQKEPKLRDQMNIYEVSQLLLAEKLACNKLREYMELGREYHDIYYSVKDDLIKFADAVRLEG